MLKVDRRQLERRPLSGCPAQQGKGTDIDTADFILVVDDCVTGPDGRPTITEIFGYFRLPGEVHDDDTLQTAIVDVPAGSSIAEIAHQMSADPDGMPTQQAGTMLRSNVARCPCTDRDECPALNEIRLLEAIEQAIGLRVTEPGHYGMPPVDALRATLSGASRTMPVAPGRLAGQVHGTDLATTQGSTYHFASGHAYPRR